MYSSTRAYFDVRSMATSIYSRHSSVLIWAMSTGNYPIGDRCIMQRMSEVSSFLVVTASIWPSIGGRS